MLPAQVCRRAARERYYEYAYVTYTCSLVQFYADRVVLMNLMQCF